jgi:hypothetical protein
MSPATEEEKRAVAQEIEKLPKKQRTSARVEVAVAKRRILAGRYGKFTPETNRVSQAAEDMGLNQRHKQTLRELLHDQPTRTLEAFFARVDDPQQDAPSKAEGITGSEESLAKSSPGQMTPPDPLPKYMQESTGDAQRDQIFPQSLVDREPTHSFQEMIIGGHLTRVWHHDPGAADYWLFKDALDAAAPNGTMKCGDVGAIQELYDGSKVLELNQRFAESMEWDRRDLLGFACQYGSVALVSYLLQNGGKLGRMRHSDRCRVYLGDEMDTEGSFSTWEWVGTPVQIALEFQQSAVLAVLVEVHQVSLPRRWSLAQKNLDRLRQLRLPSLHCPSIPLPPWLLAANELGLLVRAREADYLPSQFATTAYVWLHSLFPQGEVALDTSQRQEGASCGYVASRVITDWKLAGESWFDTLTHLRAGAECMDWVDRGNAILELSDSIHWLSAPQCLQLTDQWWKEGLTAAEGTTPYHPSMCAGDWMRVDPFDCWARGVADELVDIFQEGSQHVHRFDIVNDSESGQRGHHWISIALEMKWVGSEQDRLHVASLIPCS